MRERTVGESGLVVGEIGLGTLTWGRDTDADEAAHQLRILLDSGGNLIDTSPAFGAGAAESLLGSFLAGGVSRPDVVICSRAGFTGSGRFARFGAGRGAIMDSVEASLERLHTSYLDILVVAAPDPLAPDSETAGALTTLVAAGKVRYIGVQDYSSWRTASLQQFLLDHDLPMLNAIESEYSLLDRHIEDSHLDLAEYFSLGTLVTSPLGRGVLTGKYRRSIPPTSRAASEHLASFVAPYLDGRSRRIVEATARAADGLGVALSDVALGWVLSRPTVASALVGARTAAQLTAILGGTLELPQPVIDALDDVSA